MQMRNQVILRSPHFISVICWLMFHTPGFRTIRNEAGYSRDLFIATAFRGCVRKKH
jgi:hypothetical protein